MTPSDQIAPGETLGRRVVSKSRSKRASLRGTIQHDIFQPPVGEREISVDRLDWMTAEAATGIAERASAARGKPFYGWAVIEAGRAQANGRQTVATPQPDNPCHADIVLPPSASEDRDERKRHQQDLADEACWRERS